MENTAILAKKTVITGCLTLALGGAGLFGGAIAGATTSSGSGADGKVSTTPPAMEISTSADEQIRATGTQGAFAGPDQCTDTSRLKVDCVSQSPEATPQTKAA